MNSSENKEDDFDSVWEDKKDYKPGELLEKAKTIKEGAEKLCNKIDSDVANTIDVFFEAIKHFSSTKAHYRQIHKGVNKCMKMIYKKKEFSNYDRKHTDITSSAKKMEQIATSLTLCVFQFEKDIVEVSLGNKTEKYIFKKSKDLWFSVKDLEKEATIYIKKLEEKTKLLGSLTNTFKETFRKTIKEERKTIKEEREKKEKLLKKRTDIKHIIWCLISSSILIVLVTCPAILTVFLGLSIIALPIALLCWIFS